jgi:hypothetical protein
MTIVPLRINHPTQGGIHLHHLMLMYADNLLSQWRLAFFALDSSSSVIDKPQQSKTPSVLKVPHSGVLSPPWLGHSSKSGAHGLTADDGLYRMSTGKCCCLMSRALESYSITATCADIVLSVSWQSSDGSLRNGQLKPSWEIWKGQ